VPRNSQDVDPAGATSCRWQRSSVSGVTIPRPQSARYRR
jgi:hypothetical protein